MDDSTHTFSNFPMSGANFPHQVWEVRTLTQRSVGKCGKNRVTVPTLRKVCVEKLNRNLSKKSRDIFSFSTTPQTHTSILSWDNKFVVFGKVIKLCSKFVKL